jgi:hypothetical protein
MSDAQTANQASNSQVKANSTHNTLDAIDHEQNLETQRQKRKDSAIPVFNPANFARKNCSDNGNKQPQDVSDEYSIKESKDKDCP